MDEDEQLASDKPPKASHLCVLVHGLWGNPKHMAYIASALREKYTEDELEILTAKANSYSFTYDGIDLGAERVTQEIEGFIREFETRGGRIKKLSVVGYSLGGLVARYAIGLLYSNGWFERIQPVNFTTFATPHLGVRTPLLGVHNRLFNVLGSRTLSASGRQLFTIDSFRDTKRPLLSVLADPDSVFILTLVQFKHRVLYANIVNDRSVPYYTACVSTIDQFVNLDAIDINYLPDYDPIVLDPTDPVKLKPPHLQPPLLSRLVGSSQTLLTRVPMFALFFVLIPLGTVVFLINSGYQSLRSQQRIKLHEAGKAGIGLGSYRIPLLVENARGAMEGAFENMNAGQKQQYLPIGDSDDSDEDGSSRDGKNATGKPRSNSTGSLLKRTSSRHDDFQTLALTPEQFAMVQALNDVGFRKHRVHIHKVRHSHAAIIYRHQPRKGLDEGVIVARHWLNEEFEI
ncbi:hypothetical protein ACLMJK_006849 [Lecanora helva]